MRRQRGGGEMTGITIGLVLVIVAVIVVVTLAATGALGGRKGSAPSGGKSVIPCDAPTVNNFRKFNDHPILKHPFMVGWTPGMSLDCAQNFDWSVGYNLKTNEGVNSTNKFKLGYLYMQHEYMVDLDFPSTTKTIEGTVWLEGVPKDGSGGVKKSNEFPFTFSV